MSTVAAPTKIASTISGSLTPLYRSQQSLMQAVKRIIPPLDSSRHKGQAGRIGIVGGSRDYTGAPFFASMSSMRLGCDLSYTICTPEAGNVIKTYSPDLIVNRILDPTSSWSEIEHQLDELFQRLHAVVIGPGLGRDEFMQKCAKLCMQLARKHDMYLVVDADGLWLLQNEPEVVMGYRKAILTPNVAEFARLCRRLDVDVEGEPDRAAVRLSVALDGPTVVEKGSVDRITNGREVMHVDAKGALKRCGGQGDILAGCLGTFAGWVKIFEQDHPHLSENSTQDELVAQDRLLLLAGYGAALTARTCSRLAFEKKKRAMLADDLLPEVGVAYEQLWCDSNGLL